MKPYHVVITCTVLFTACIKQAPKEDETNWVYRTLYFKEKGTNIPISNVKVRMSVCLWEVGWGGCDRGYRINLVSDALGKCDYKIEAGAATLVDIQHEKYVNISDGPAFGDSWIPKEGEIMLYPKSTLAISVHKNNANSTNNLQIVLGDSSSVVNEFDKLLFYNPEHFISSDTILYSDLSGNSLYFMRWKVNAQDSILSFMAPRFDTVRVAININ